ncbi:hypothetical protein EVAR_27268_1 [Eumeta japonica]|uniref:Uncharacterized protein n=1 Tax=Eumeta variegata TaxID=151549 RepID=A0A4C1VZP9_EUMVA|nr:hypothetical protein EVAR_27268_1 [Eumeta japonica]
MRAAVRIIGLGIVTNKIRVPYSKDAGCVLGPCSAEKFSDLQERRQSGYQRRLFKATSATRRYPPGWVFHAVLGVTGVS